jgi:hypothetical protein
VCALSVGALWGCVRRVQYSKLRTLDLSWNMIERITGLETLGQLRELKLYHNKLTTIENLSEYVDVGVVVVV